VLGIHEVDTLADGPSKPWIAGDLEGVVSRKGFPHKYLFTQHLRDVRQIARLLVPLLLFYLSQDCKESARSAN
jgi:hypothetical protein